MSPDGAAILVVDDNEDNLYTLTQRLRREGYTSRHDRTRRPPGARAPPIAARSISSCWTS